MLFSGKLQPLYATYSGLLLIIVPPHSKQFGKPIASFQLIQKKLADASMEASREMLAFAD